MVNATASKLRHNLARKYTPVVYSTFFQQPFISDRFEARVIIARENMITRRVITTLATFVFYFAAITAPPLRPQANVAQPASPPRAIVLHAAHLLYVETGRTVSPGEILVQGELIVEVGSHVTHPHESQLVDLGDATLLPGLIDAHVHLFLHPGAEDLQTVQESVPQRTILATLA